MKHHILTPYYWLKRNEILLFRIAFGLIFFWFGFLKIIDMSAIKPFVERAYPILATQQFFPILGIFEMIIGTGFFAGRYLKFFAILMILHIFGTFVLFITKPNLMFNPYFPIFTLEGEFVLKNIAILVGGLAIISHLKKSKKNTK